MRAAITAVRREGFKVSLVYAAVDAAAVALLVNLALSVVQPAALPAGVSLPASVGRAVSFVTGTVVGDLMLPGAALVAFGAGAAVFLAEFLVRSRRPFVEQFESANPEVREALRTARDAVEDGAETRMARRLYEEVLDRLRATSSLGLIDLRRLAVTLLVVVAVSLASVQVAVVDLDLEGLGGGGPTGPGGQNQAPEFTGLKNGSAVLGDPTDVNAGDVDLNATLPTSGDGTGEAQDSARSYETSGLPTGDVESQEAGYAPAEELEDADLIREYNLRIRENETNG